MRNTPLRISDTLVNKNAYLGQVTSNQQDTQLQLSIAESEFIDQRLSDDLYESCLLANYYSDIYCVIADLDNLFSEFSGAEIIRGFKFDLAYYLSIKGRFRYVKTYKDVCTLVELINNKDYDKSNLLYTYFEFARIIAITNFTYLEKKFGKFQKPT